MLKTHEPFPGSKTITVLFKVNGKRMYQQITFTSEEVEQGQIPIYYVLRELVTAKHAIIEMSDDLAYSAYLIAHRDRH